MQSPCTMIRSLSPAVAAQANGNPSLGITCHHQPRPCRRAITKSFDVFAKGRQRHELVPFVSIFAHERSPFDRLMEVSVRNLHGIILNLSKHDQSTLLALMIGLNQGSLVPPSLPGVDPAIALDFAATSLTTLGLHATLRATRVHRKHAHFPGEIQ